MVDLSPQRTVAQRFAQFVYESGLTIKPQQIAGLSLTACAAVGGPLWYLSGSWPVAVVAAAIAAVLPTGYVFLVRKRRMEKLLSQLPDAFELMGRTMKAGQTISQALQAVGDEMSAPVADEFGYCFEQQNLGLSAEGSLRDLARRTGLLEIKIFVLSVMVHRQTKIRRSLPDALDIMVVCLQGGLSLTGTLARVARELVSAHPLLAVELNIVERQIRMGHTAGQALRDFARRFDLEELRSMASVVSQSERIGSSVVGALTVFADTMRVRRHQRAEELAHKAAVKMLFPTLFCIFPAIFIVILGPAAIQIYQQLGDMVRQTSQ